MEAKPTYSKIQSGRTTVTDRDHDKLKGVPQPSDLVDTGNMLVWAQARPHTCVKKKQLNGQCEPSAVNLFTDVQILPCTQIGHVG